MQETTQEKPPAAKGTVKMPTTAEKYFADLHADKLTRVPVAHLYFNEPIDFAGVGESQISNRGCVRLVRRLPPRVGLRLHPDVAGLRTELLPVAGCPGDYRVDSCGACAAV
jgi:hypothetical protein